MSNNLKKKVMKNQQQMLNNAMKVEIIISPNGQINVAGFPSNFAMAMDIMTKATARVAGHFVGKASAGEVDDQGNLIQNKIVVPDNKLVGMDGRKLN